MLNYRIMSPQVFDASKFNEVKRYGKTKSNVLALSLKENASGQEGREAQKKKDTDAIAPRMSY